MIETTKKTTLNSSVAFRLSDADFEQLLADSEELNVKPSEFARQWLPTRRETLAEIVNLRNQNNVLLAEQTKTERQFGVFRRVAYGVLATQIFIAVVILATLVLLPEPIQSTNEAVFRREGVRP